MDGTATWQLLGSCPVTWAFLHHEVPETRPDTGGMMKYVKCSASHGCISIWKAQGWLRQQSVIMVSKDVYILIRKGWDPGYNNLHFHAWCFGICKDNSFGGANPNQTQDASSVLMEMQQYLDAGSRGSSRLLSFSIVTVPAARWIWKLAASNKLLVSCSEMLSTP